MKARVLLPALLAKAETMSDKGLKLVFYTRELGEDAGALFSKVQTEGWLLYSENENITEADIPDEKADPMLGTKTQAQRLRSSLYRLWEQKGKNGEFEEYYRVQLERIIETVKEKLEG